MKRFLLIAGISLAGCGGGVIMSDDTTGGSAGRQGVGGASSAGPASSTGGSSIASGARNAGGQGSPGTAEQQLASTLPSWCAGVCSKINQCDAPPCICEGDVCSCVELPDPAMCSTDCIESSRETFIGQGEACAQLALTMMNCVSGATCEQIFGSQPSPCETDITAVCSSATPITPTTGTVTCPSRGGTGTDVGGTITPGTALCDVTRNECSDGHTYRISCFYGSNNQAECSCIVDGVPRAGYATSNFATCQNSQEVNAGCGWQLAY